MAAGKPIIASEVEGVRDSISHSVEGLLVRPGDIKEFPDSVITLIDQACLERKEDNASATGQASQ